MEDYLNQFKSISDQLALASAPVEDEDLVLLVLNGLPDEYNAFKTTIRARSDPISMEDLSSLLWSGFASLKQTHTSDIPFAYSATRGNYKGGNRGGHRGSFRGRGYSSRGSDFFKGSEGCRGSESSGRFRGSSQHGSTFRGNGQYHRGRSNFNSNALVCQICGKLNHTAIDCWYRMDSSFQSSPQNSPHQSSFIQNNPTAYVASASPSSVASSPSSSSNWFLGSDTIKRIWFSYSIQDRITEHTFIEKRKTIS